MNKLQYKSLYSLWYTNNKAIVSNLAATYSQFVLQQVNLMCKYLVPVYKERHFLFSPEIKGDKRQESV